MDNQPDILKVKVVHVVLFLDWQKREEWTPYLEKAAEKKCIQIGKRHFLLAKKNKKNGTVHRYTGQFPQYPLLVAPEKKLFEKYDLWRFIEVAQENGEDVLIDSYVVFCSDMRREGGRFWIEKCSIKDTEKSKKQWTAGGVDTEYRKIYNEDGEEEKNGFFRWFPLPYPSALREKINYDAKETYFVFHHLHKLLPENGDFIIRIFGRADIEKNFRSHLCFSTKSFFKIRNMQNIFIYFDSTDSSYGFFKFLNGMRPLQIRIEGKPYAFYFGDDFRDRVNFLIQNSARATDLTTDLPTLRSCIIYTHRSEEETEKELKRFLDSKIMEENKIRYHCYSKGLEGYNRHKAYQTLGNLMRELEQLAKKQGCEIFVQCLRDRKSDKCPHNEMEECLGKIDRWFDEIYGCLRQMQTD